jgi:hypothetical protein
MVLDRRVDVRCSGQVGARNATSVRRSSSVDVDGQEGYGQEDKDRIVCAYSKIAVCTPKTTSLKYISRGVDMYKSPLPGILTKW